MLSQQHINIRNALLITLCCLLAACANQQIADSKRIQSEAAQQANNAKLGIDEVILEVQQMLTKASEDELDFYSPLHLNNAKEQITLAQKYIENPPKEIANAAMTSAIAAKNIISKAYSNKEQVLSNLKNVLAAKEILDELDVQSIYKSDYENSLESLKDLIVKIETGALKEAIGKQGEVIAEMTELEINFLLKVHMQKAKDFLEQAYDVEADDYAPVSFITALNKIESSEQYIRNNNRNRIGVKNAGEEALLAVQQAYFIAVDSKTLVNMLPEEAETHLVALRTSLNKVNQHLKDEELPPQLLNTSTEQLISQAKHMKSEHQQVERKLKNTEENFKELKAQFEEQKSKQEVDQLEDAEWLTPTDNEEAEAFEMVDE